MSHLSSLFRSRDKRRNAIDGSGYSFLFTYTNTHLRETVYRLETDIKVTMTGTR